MNNPTLSIDEFQAWEATQTHRHELVGGEIFAMTGGTLAHNAATGATFATLRHHLRGSPCRVYVADVKVNVRASNCSFYPDVVVSCQPSDAENPRALALHSPILVVEVLSPSTGALTAAVSLPTTACSRACRYMSLSTLRPRSWRSSGAMRRAGGSSIPATRRPRRWSSPALAGKVRWRTYWSEG